MNWLTAERIIRNALEEDLGAGDITTELALPPGAMARGRFVAKAQGVLCGVELARMAFSLVGAHGCASGEQSTETRAHIREALADGSALAPGTVIGIVECSAHALLAAERVALNLLQRLSGIASLAHKLAQRAAEHGIHICETRKTTPGLRLFEKYAVRVGGGFNHRIGLDSAILLKDNHFALSALTPADLLREVRAKAGHTLRLIAEAQSVEMLGELAAAGANVVLLDNFSPDEVRQALVLAQAGALAEKRRALGLGRVVIEVSGGVNADNISNYLIPGVDVISIGALTHSAPALDISLEAEAL